jgi:predicted RNA-binding protein associated with RNAse of E/G family
MSTITVRLVKPGKDATITYRGALRRASPTHLIVAARWEFPTTDLGYVRFEPGDRFTEHYYTDRWYNVNEVRRPDGALKGWYCNITRPAELRDGELISEDLELDLFVSPDRARVLVLDEDEFAARGLERSDPAAHAAALAALDELRSLAARGAPPFDAAQGSGGASEPAIGGDAHL